MSVAAVFAVLGEAEASSSSNGVPPSAALWALPDYAA